MRLPADREIARFIVTLTVCVVSFTARPLEASHLPPAPRIPPADAPAVSGPAADYPVVIGQPYTVGDTLFTPDNGMNYDAVGYASVNRSVAGVSAAHHTLPLPSYVEVTALESGRTILVRIERRGPMDSTHAIEISSAAAAQLGINDDGRVPVRVRRVNPAEVERALLRAGNQAPERIPTPKPLLAVLERRLASDPAVEAIVKEQRQKEQRQKEQHEPALSLNATYGASFTEVSLGQLSEHGVSAIPPIIRTAMVVQIGAFSDQVRANTLAHRAAARVFRSGSVWRVRLGPYASRGQAEAALAKARAAGYSEARIQRGE